MKFKYPINCLFLILSINTVSYSDLFINKFNVGLGLGARYLNYTIDFNQINQKYQTGNSAGLNAYFQGYLISDFGFNFGLYQEFNGHPTLIGLSDSGDARMVKYSSEGGSGIVKLGLFKDLFKLVQTGTDIGFTWLGLRPAKYNTNDFNGYALSVFPNIKLNLSKMDSNAGAIFLFFEKSFLGNISGYTIGGSFNWQLKFNLKK